MTEMFKYLKPYGLLTLLAPLFMFLEVMMDLLQPLFMQRIVDIGIATGDMDYVLTTLAAMLGVALIGYIGGVGCSYFSAKAAINMSTDIRENLFSHVQNLSYGNIDRLKTGNLITRLTNDIVQVQNITMLMLRIMVRSPLQIIGSLIMTYIISPRLFLILLVVVPLLIITMAIVLIKGYPLYKTVQQKLDHVNTVMQENLSGIRVVKAFVREDFEKKRFAGANDSFTDTTIKVSRTMAVMTPVTMILLNVAVVAVLWFGNIEVTQGNLQVGKVMAFINYLLQLLNALMLFANLLIQYSRGQASAERIHQVFCETPDINDSEEAELMGHLSGDLVFNSVSFSYDTHSPEPVLTDISFTASPGEKIAIIGSTGSGKSTLVNLIPRLYDVTAGSITIGGKNVKNIHRKSLRDHIGMVLQQTLLFSGSIYENITYGKEDATEPEVFDVATGAGAHDFISGFEQGYDTVLGQKGVNLSGGQKQRISIARGLLRKPYILILDDSTSAVDVATEARIQQSLKKFTDDSIVIMVAQRISCVLDADRILVLDEGRIVGNGNHRTLIKENEAYIEIYESQLGKVGDSYGA